MSVWGSVPDWVAAIGTVGTLSAGLWLLQDQGRALRLQNEVMQAELRQFHQAQADRERAQIMEARAQAEQVRFHKLDRFRDPMVVREFLEWSGRKVASPLVFELVNGSGDRVRGVAATSGETAALCAVRDGDGEAQEGGVAVVAPGQSVRFYWWSNQVLDYDDVCVYFRDAAGALWGIHDRDGLFAPDDPDR